MQTNQQIKPVLTNQKMLNKEKERHNNFLEKHFDKSERLQEKHSDYISQVITLEGVILGAVVLFTDENTISLWLIFAAILLLFSLIFGIWRQNLSTKSGHQTHEWNYYQELKTNWFTRELWKDSNVDYEKNLMEPHIKKRESAHKKTFMYCVLKRFGLNADRIENIFLMTFIFSLVMLIFHLLFETSSLLSHSNSYPIFEQTKLGKLLQ